MLKNTYEFEVSFLNVGQGNGILFEQENGVKILVDAGTGLLAKQSLQKELSFFDKNIDIAFVTHYDLDHAGNFLDYLNQYRIFYFFDNGKTIDNPIFFEIQKKLGGIKSQSISLDNRYAIFVTEDFFIDVIFPHRDIEVNKLRDNSSSLVLKFVYKDKSILVTGDLPSKFEKWLVETYPDKLKSDILLAGHHGSKTSTSQEFLDAVNPEYIIFSSGENNSYGHPNEGVLERVEALKIPYFRTDIHGTIKYVLQDGLWAMQLEKK